MTDVTALQLAWQDAKRAFEAIDTDKSGFIDIHEFKTLLSQSRSDTLGLAVTELKDEEIQKAIKALDSSGTGKISFKDFCQWYIDSLQLKSATRRKSSSEVPTLTRPTTLERRASAQVPFLTQFLQPWMSETYFCEICFSREMLDASYTLSECQHKFCKTCLSEYFTSKINDGQVYLSCFVSVPTIDSESKSEICGKRIAESDIIANITEPLRTKYYKFKQSIDDPQTRECSKCHHLQRGDASQPEMTCQKCSWKYCFTHGDQHPTSSCLEYERKHRKENLKTEALIALTTKPCPKCRSPIQKRSGCNHMKCPQCGVAFCWLCGSEIEDVPFPEHFKQTNITSRCAGRQFGNHTSPSSRFGLCLRMLLIWIFIMPIAIPLAIATWIITFPCMCCIYLYDPQPDGIGFCQFLGIRFIFYLSTYGFVAFLIYSCILCPILCCCACTLLCCCGRVENREDLAARALERQVSRDVDAMDIV